MNSDDSPAGTHFQYAFGRRLFAAALGGVCAVAFVSLALQVRALIGSHGISPAAEFLPQVRQALGNRAWREVPTFFWFGVSDSALVAVCWLGAGLSALLACGRAPGLMALLAWGLYLSLCSVGSPFLDFQWDILLLESALVAAIALPWKWNANWALETPVQKVGRWLVWWLLVRLMFESGVVKLTWNDPTWWNLTALQVHFETQPIPNVVSWFAHQSPAWLLRGICLAMLVVEIAVPFLIAFPRRWRHGASIAMILLQAGILLTGNFAFFNWLTIALCLPLFDDGFWPKSWRVARDEPPPGPRPSWWPTIAASALALIVFALTAPTVLEAFNISVPQHFAALRSFNSYGLFRVMTVERPEIVIEGSRDGINWDAYEFHWKPGNIYRAPGWVAPLQPRLDWQMWFAALSDVQHNPWFVNLLVRLLQGSPDVLAQFEKNPFADAPPRYVRASLYDYHFTRWGDHTAAWWKREPKGLYCPPLSLRALEETQR